MVIVRISSGLGNQMFQYALYRALELQGVRVKADIHSFERANDGRHYELEQVFGIQPKKAGKLACGLLKVFSKITLWLTGKPYKEPYAEFGTFNPAYLKRRHAYLNGYWQTECYFSEAAMQIRNDFQFDIPEDAANRHWLNQIENTESVSMHIRRTDFVQQYNWGIDPSYYHQAIGLMRSKISQPQFFIFSDDMPWAREHFQGADFHFVEGNSGAQSFRDMQLMQACKHQIIANSTFSWWGAWLNRNPNKIIIAPDCWQPEIQGTRNIVPESWIQLPTGMLKSNR